jgi:hypothetical protein
MVLTPKQYAAKKAMERYVRLVGGNVDEIIQINNQFLWTDPDGETHKIGATT